MAVNFSGSLVITGSLITTGTITMSGSIASASFATNATSASFALTASYISGSGGGVGFPFSGSAIITGSLFVSGSTISGSFKGDGSQITGLTAGGKIHTQSSAASTWTVSHNLGVQYPNVTVYNASNEVIIPQTITATDSNTLTLTFGSAVAGYAVSGIGGIINVQGRTTQQYFAAATTWSFAHNLGDRYVSIQAFDDAFEMMIPTTIRLVDATSSIMLFDSASSGYAVATIGGDLPAISSSYAGYTLQVANSAPYSASWVAVPNVTVTTAVSSSFAATASSADNLTVRGTLTAQTINVQTITSSIEFITGSTRNGSIAGNTHQFTGSVLVTGSGTFSSGITSNGNINISASDPRLFIRKTSNSQEGDIIFYENNNGHWVLSDSPTTNDFAIYNYSTATNNIVIKYSTGNVGIGTTSPSASLETRVAVESPATNKIALIAATSNGANDIFRWYDGATQLGVFKNNGNVGIGTSSPDTNLTVWGANIALNQAPGNVNIYSTTAFGANVGGSIGLGGYYNATTGYIAFGSIHGKKENGTADNAGGYLAFITRNNSAGSVERMRITSIGAINILGSYFLADSGTGYRFNNQADSFNNFIISDNGNASLRGALTQNASDERLKNNIKIIPNAIDKIKQLRGVYFEWNQELYETSRTTDIGVIAQDIQKILPDAVTLAPFDTDGNTGLSKSGDSYLTVYYEKIIPLLIEGIKELKSENDTLKEILQRNNIQ